MDGQLHMLDIVDLETGYRIGREAIHWCHGVNSARAAAVLFEVSDLLTDLAGSRTISGIQRVQLGLASYLFSEQENGSRWIASWSFGREIPYASWQMRP